MEPQPEGRGRPNGLDVDVTRVSGLQWSHSPKAVEDARTVLLFADTREASMEPQPEGRGRRLRPQRPGAHPGNASMEPQPEGRGRRQPPESRPDRLSTASMEP